MQLPHGLSALVRPIQPRDDAALRRGLKRLSPEGQVYRFLHTRKDFTDQELHYLTHCDMVDHIAMLLVLLDADNVEVDAIGVARCVRRQDDPASAEVAVVLVDEWQKKGGGTLLLQTLAAEAWAADIRQWQAFCLADNTAVQHLLAKVGSKISERILGHGMLELLYQLDPPTD